ncbi:hypothetical protein IWZ01DRAFT_497487 [Phyllosticta capitalensis]
MAEYWKSTPKYWCKFCKTHIRDTKFERQQHEATGRHQIAIQRSLRELHRDREREDREKQRAKDEVARLNGVVGSSASAATSGGAGASGGRQAAGAREPKRQATVEDRKKQLAQLAAMGVAVPDEYRREMAMVGEWETVAIKPIGEQQQQKGAGDDTSGTLNVGVRKRKKDDDDEENEGGAQRPKRGWGNTFKTYSSTAKGVATEDDIEALLSTARKPVVKKEEETLDDAPHVKPDPDAAGAQASMPEHDNDAAVKTEEAGSEDVKPDPETSEAAEGAKLADIPPVTTEAEEDAGAAKSEDVGVIFKKRKSKALRQK